MNVLFIVADDLNGWIGPLGRNPDVKTPSIDALAARGTLFVNAYCAAPYCNASRMAMFTGCPPHVTGVYGNEPFWDGPGRRPTFIERFGEAGYHRHGAGKVFHEGIDIASATRSHADSVDSIPIENRDFAWDEFHPNTTEPLPRERPFNGRFGLDLDARGARAYYAFDWGPLPAEREPEMFDEKVAARTMAFLENPREPFLCAAGFFKPHLPWYVPTRFFDLYDPSEISLPLVRDDDLDDVPEAGRRFARQRDHALVTEHDEWRPAVHGYLAAISYVDHQIGRVVDALEAAGLDDHTAIVLCGDNGFHLGEKLHWRKFALWEEATRVPLIVSLPGEKGGQRVFEPVSLIDLFPTLLELAGIEHPPLDWAESLVPLIRPGMRRQTPVLSTWLEGNHSIRTGDWRLIRYADGGLELYDHRTDPYEWTNLADWTVHGPVVEELSRLLPIDGSA